MLYHVSNGRFIAMFVSKAEFVVYMVIMLI